jgi:uncharacterized membrane protein YphA (DoxX/SURF4 family)
MRFLPIVVGILLGLLFIASGLFVLLHSGPLPMPEGMPAAAVTFMGVLASTGYLTFVKVLEVVGGTLVAIPRTRNFGLLVLGPIIVNILAFNIFIMKGAGLAGSAVIALPAAYLLWVGRKSFAGLLN